MIENTNDIANIPFRAADGTSVTLSDYAGKVLLIVNVASKCGFTPQYEQLVDLQNRYSERGFTVLGFPCNQFMGQEPGKIEDIIESCAANWGATFPIFDKVKVNGPNAAPLYKALKKARDENGKRGPIMWNFEKFVLTPSGKIFRFRPTTEPDDPAIVSVIEANLPR